MKNREQLSEVFTWEKDDQWIPGHGSEKAFREAIRKTVFQYTVMKNR